MLPINRIIIISVISCYHSHSDDIRFAVFSQHDVTFIHLIGYGMEHTCQITCVNLVFINTLPSYVYTLFVWAIT